MLNHIVSQVQANVEFLASQNYISRTDADQFLAKLPSSDDNPQPKSTFRPATKAASNRAPPAAPVKRQAPAAPQVVQARALWSFNEDNAEPGDLSFSAGDVIEILEETNADWWTGRFRGKQGVFPSNYVEKITSPISETVSEKPVYRPFGAAYHGLDQPPPAGQGVNSVGLQGQPEAHGKKSKFGGLGDTMAQSAAGGVGFGAGAAIGGGLVRALF